MLSDRLRGKVTKANGLNLQAYVEQWLETQIKPHRAPNTYNQYKWLLKTHVIPRLGSKRLDAITRQDIQALINDKGKEKALPKTSAKQKQSPTKPLGARTLQLIKAVLHSAYNDAVEDNLARHNPADNLKVPKKQAKPGVFLDQPQAIAFCNVCKGHELEELFMFLINTGTRIGEATGLRWEDVNTEACAVTIRGQLQRQNSKLIRVESTKTNQQRILPISKALAASLQLLRLKHEGMGFSDPDDLVFLNAYGRRVDQKYVNQHLARVCKQAGIPHISAHKLRHTAATLLMAATGNHHSIQKFLGHKNVSLTTDLYGHATAELLRPMSAALEDVLAGGVPNHPSQSSRSS